MELKSDLRLAKAILLASVCVGIVRTPNSLASTKVGNGNDGADLERLTNITSGPIWEARQGAVEAVRRLNVAGVPGLGQLIPEINKTDLLMASEDVHPTVEPSGSLEVSHDRRHVYARTFPEPNADTRFFPAAQGLSTDQLVALHIHEALHRALPRDVRENENVVMHITMAITSPGASFDRVRQVASLYVPSEAGTSKTVVSSPTSVLTKRISVARSEAVMPPRSHSEFGVQFDQYTGGKEVLMPGLEFKTSLGGFRPLGPVAVEPVFHARVKVLEGQRSNSVIGPTSFELAGRMMVGGSEEMGPFAVVKEDGAVWAPFIRFSAKSLEGSSRPVPSDRDVLSIGVYYQVEDPRFYLDSSIFYSLPSNTNVTSGLGQLSTEFGPILSLSARWGAKVGRWQLGAASDLHASEGKTWTEDDPYANWDGTGQRSRIGPTRILTGGPEATYKYRNIKLKFYGKWMLNSPQSNLDDLGDIVDRGSGRGGVGTMASFDF